MAKRYILPTTLPKLSTGEEDEVKKPTEYTLVAVFDRSGRYIYTGTSRGHFNVIDAETREVTFFGIQANLCSWSNRLDYVLRPLNISGSPIKVEISASTVLIALSVQFQYLETLVSALVDGGIHMMVATTMSLMMTLSRYSINFKISSIVYSGTHAHSVEPEIMLWVHLALFHDTDFSFNGQSGS